MKIAEEVLARVWVDDPSLGVSTTDSAKGSTEHGDSSPRALSELHTERFSRCERTDGVRPQDMRRNGPATPLVVSVVSGMARR